jgi:hypothetical protein
MAGSWAGLVAKWFVEMSTSRLSVRCGFIIRYHPSSSRAAVLVLAVLVWGPKDSHSLAACRLLWVARGPLLGWLVYSPAPALTNF